MKRLIFFIVCLIFTPLSENVPVSDEFSESSESSLTFTWTSPLQLQVRNNQGEMDEIELRPTKSIGSFPVDCLFDGYLLNEVEGSVAVSGCQDWTEVTIVIMSRYSSGSMFKFTPENNMTQEVKFAPSFLTDYWTQELDEDSYVDNKMRSKRSYHPIDEIETYDAMYHGEKDMPEALVFSFRIAYEDSFFKKMNERHREAENYINRVTHLSRPYFEEKNLGVKIYFNVTKEIEYLQNKTFKIGTEDLESAKAINSTEPLSIYVFTNDRDIDMGISVIRGACRKRSRLLNKWRSDITKAVITNVHEHGHWFAMVHDDLEDDINEINKEDGEIDQITSYSRCNNTGVMTKIPVPPKKWSECSRKRFEWFYQNKKATCPFLKQVCSADEVNFDPCVCHDQVGGGRAACNAGDYCHNDGTCQPDEVVFLAGGLNNEASTEVLDLPESSPSCTNPVDPLPSSRWGHTINYVNSSLILCGGISPTNPLAATMSCIKAESGTGKWVHHSTTTMPRAAHSSAVAGDLHLFSGAYDGALGSLELFKGGRWMNAQSQSFRLGEGSCSVRIDDRTVIITGGKASLKTTSRWNAGNYTLNLFGDMELNVGRMGHGCDAIAINGKLYVVVAGGMDLHGNALMSTEILDVTEMKEWVMMGDMQRARWAGRLVTVRIAGIPTIFSMGGWNKDDQHMNSVEELMVDTSDLSKSEWILKNVTMNVKRTYFAAVTSPKREFC